MKFTKMTLIKTVIAESSLEDVLSGSWQQQANQDMDVEFYRDKTELFWKELEELLSVLRNMPVPDQEEWADYYKFPEEIKIRVYEWLERMDVSWVRQHITDEFVYGYIKKWGLDSGNAESMYELANTVVPHVLKTYVGKP
jgi:hypothetical protein